MKSLIEKLNDGGPIFTYTIMILLLVILVMIVRAFLQNDNSKKTRAIIASMAWFALAWGYLGRTFGLIMAFDNIAAAGEITPQHMAGGLKMALVGPLCGLVAFLVARLGIVLLQLKAKREDHE
jgi:mannose/fructose/N-acetylgalactosamine-specific phosphotransferase system component IID